jgi:hypothetical protein
VGRANFSQRRTLDGPWALGAWRDYVKTRRDAAVVVLAALLGVAVFVVCIIWLT